MKADFRECDTPNMYGEQCGCFMGENSMASDERGVRPNADLSMVCAFLVRYGKGQVSLPEGVTWDNLESMARRSLVFAYSTHKANRLKTCKGGDYWGSVSKDDHVWESSLWAMSVAYSAFFQWESLSQSQQDCIEAMLVAECNYELERDVPTGSMVTQKPKRTAGRQMCWLPPSDCFPTTGSRPNGLKGFGNLP